jgi:FkbM family methyltransferase
MGTVKQATQVLRYVWTHPANRDARLRGVGRAVAFQVRGRLGRPTFATLGRRSRMLAELHHTAAAKVVYANPPDWPEMLAWRRILRPGDLFVDVGSNVGAYALWAAELDADVIAVEPDPGAALRLRCNAGMNDYPVEVLECALADRAGELALTTGLDATNHLVLGFAGRRTRTVEVRTLDAVLGERRAAGVKVDVEGAERLVLQGASRALAERRVGVLQLEWNDLCRDVLRETREPIVTLLRDFGYRFRRPDGYGRLVDVDPSGYGADLFAVASGSLLA